MKLEIRKPLRTTDRVKVDKFEPTLTQQHHENETNINTIMAKALKSGIMPVGKDMNLLKFGDFETGFDYQESMNKIIAANESFEALPSQIRNRFRNDPALFLDFVSDESNRQEAVSLGLIQDVKGIAASGVDTLEEPAQSSGSGDPSKGQPQSSGKSGRSPGEPALEPK